tara:strand:- start:396 stop:1196 length:801 start_codon:yes stop_codon:yes gene_type:complete
MNTTSYKYKKDLDLALEAVKKSGKIALARFGKQQKIWEKSKENWVCEADKEVDDTLKKHLTAARPSYGWLSEETVDNGLRENCLRTWIVDPIDGTSSYLQGIAEFAISVALVESGKPIIGIVFNPASNELFIASKGNGATLNGKKLSVTNTDTGQNLHILSSRSENRESGWPKLFTNDNVTVVSSIAYKFALVAAGQYDVAASVWPKNDWDICAGHLLVEEAGGTVSALDGSPLVYNCSSPRHLTCAASNGKIHSSILKRLQIFHN